MPIRFRRITAWGAFMAWVTTAFSLLADTALAKSSQSSGLSSMRRISGCIVGLPLGAVLFVSRWGKDQGDLGREKAREAGNEQGQFGKVFWFDDIVTDAPILALSTIRNQFGSGKNDDRQEFFAISP